MPITGTNLSLFVRAKKRWVGTACLAMTLVTALLAFLSARVEVDSFVDLIALKKSTQGGTSSSLDVAISQLVHSWPLTFRVYVSRNGSVVPNVPLPAYVALSLGNGLHHRVGLEAEMSPQELRAKYALGNKDQSLHAIVSGSRLFTLDVTAFSKEEEMSFSSPPNLAPLTYRAHDMTGDPALEAFWSLACEAVPEEREQDRPALLAAPKVNVVAPSANRKSTQVAVPPSAVDVLLELINSTKFAAKEEELDVPTYRLFQFGARYVNSVQGGGLSMQRGKGGGVRDNAVTMSLVKLMAGRAMQGGPQQGPAPDFASSSPTTPSTIGYTSAYVCSRETLASAADDLDANPVWMVLKTEWLRPLLLCVAFYQSLLKASVCIAVYSLACTLSTWPLLELAWRARQLRARVPWSHTLRLSLLIAGPITLWICGVCPLLPPPLAGVSMLRQIGSALSGPAALGRALRLDDWPPGLLMALQELLLLGLVAHVYDGAQAEGQDGVVEGQAEPEEARLVQGPQAQQHDQEPEIPHGHPHQALVEGLGSHAGTRDAHVERSHRRHRHTHRRRHRHPSSGSSRHDMRQLYDWSQGPDLAQLGMQAQGMHAIVLASQAQALAQHANVLACLQAQLVAQLKAQQAQLEVLRMAEKLEEEKT